MLDNVKLFSCGFFLFPVAGEGDSSYGIDKKESIRACEKLFQTRLTQDPP